MKSERSFLVIVRQVLEWRIHAHARCPTLPPRTWGPWKKSGGKGILGHMSTSIEWLPEPEEANYPAALSYLSLLFRDSSQIVEKLKKAPVTQFKAKDIFRASGLSLLGISNSHVQKDLAKIAAGKHLSPILLVRREGEKVIIADGYHRICAVYSLNEDALIPCKIVSF